MWDIPWYFLFCPLFFLSTRYSVAQELPNLFHNPLMSNDLQSENHCYSSVQFSHSVVSDSLWPHWLQHARPPCLLPTPRVYSNSCPLSRWANQPSHPLLSTSPPAFNLSQHHGLFKWVSSSHQLAKVLEFQLQHQSFQWIFRTDFL